MSDLSKLTEINTATDRPCAAVVTLPDLKHARHDIYYDRLI